MPEITIYDVASKAGVSIATVSNVLNVPERVRASTRERVLRVIDELGFEPKADATARARRTVGRIGIVAPFTSYPSFNLRLHGVIEALRDTAYEIVIYDQKSLALQEDYLSHLPIRRHLDGVIVMSLPFDDQVANRLLAHELQTVLIEFTRPEFSAVNFDNVEGGRLAARHLIARGHTRCAFVGEAQVGSTIIAQRHHRLNGFRQVLTEAGIDLPETYISYARHGVEEARQQTHQLLDLPNPPTAIFAHSDVEAVGVIKAARDRGLRIPEDLAVIGFDDIEVADYMGITTIHQPLLDSGRVAARILLERMDDPSVPIQHVMLPLTLVQRETT